MIKNFLKNGSEIKDLTGHVVKEVDAPELYRILDRIREGGADGSKDRSVREP